MTSMKDRMLAGEPYIADEPEILADLDRVVRELA
ncbi:maltose acetyltransferase domain-containing protein [Micromonospora sp. NPDC047707]